MCLVANQIKAVDECLQQAGYEAERRQEQFHYGRRTAWVITHRSKDRKTKQEKITKVVLVDADKQQLPSNKEVPWTIVDLVPRVLQKITKPLGRGRFVDIEGSVFYEIGDRKSPCQGAVFHVSFAQGMHYHAPHGAVIMDDEAALETYRDLVEDNQSP